MTEYHVRSRPGGTTVRVSRPGGVTRVRTRLAGGPGGGGGGGAVDSVDGRTGVVTLDDLYQTVGVEIATVDTTLAGPPRTVITAIVDGTVTLPTAGVGDVGQHWHISTGPYELTVVGCDGGDVTVPVGMVLSVVGFEGPGPVYGWAQLGFKTIDAPTSGGADLSDATPQALGTAAAGTGTAAARDDHVHAMPTASSITVDASGFNGNLTTSDDTVQEVAQKLDDLTIPSGGADVLSSLDVQPSITNAGTWPGQVHTAVALPVCAAGDLIEFDAVVEWVNNSGVARRPIFRLTLGSTTIAGATPTTTIGSPTTRQFVVSGRIQVLSTTSQRVAFTSTCENYDAIVGTGVATETMTSSVNLTVSSGSNSATGDQSAQLLCLHIRKVSA